jgi:Tol biopolymer transport system component
MRRPVRFLLVLFAAALAACAAAGQPEDPVAETAAAEATTPSAEVLAPTAPLTQPPAEAPLSIRGLTGKIAYSYEGDVYVMNADGSGVTRLTSDPAMDFDPAWSPDGARIAFRSHRDGNEEVYLMNANGSSQQNLSNAPAGGDYSPAWSPDGEWIAFMSDRGGNPNLWVMRPDGSDLRQVTDLPGISEYPAWSPDGRRIAFHCTLGKVLPGGAGDFEICVVNADGSRLTQLTDAPGESKLPAWSPDGAQIAFQSNRHGWPTLPGYVPLGYDPGRFGDYDIYIMNIDGSEQRNLTLNPRQDDSFPAWSRAGYLVFTRYGCLIVMTADGQSMVQISKSACTGKDSGQFPDWYQTIRSPTPNRLRTIRPEAFAPGGQVEL